MVEIAGCHYMGACLAYFLVFDDEGGWVVEARVSRGRWWVTPANTAPGAAVRSLVRQGLASRSAFVRSIADQPVPMGEKYRPAYMGRDTTEAVRIALRASGRKVWPGLNRLPSPPPPDQSPVGNPPTSPSAVAGGFSSEVPRG